MQLRVRKAASTTIREPKRVKKKKSKRKHLKDLSTQEIVETCSIDNVQMSKLSSKMLKVVLIHARFSPLSKKFVMLQNKTNDIFNKSESDIAGSSVSNNLLSHEHMKESQHSKKNVREVESAVSSPIILRRSNRNKVNKAVDKAEITAPQIQAEVTVPVLSPLQRANLSWIKLISESFHLSLGTIVCAKMNTFWPWPAQIICFNNSRIKVRFFGDFTYGSIDKKQCVPFNKCSAVILFYIESIPPKSREEYLKLLHHEYNEKERSSYLKRLNRRALYMQAVEDVGIYLDMKKSVLCELLSALKSS